MTSLPIFILRPAAQAEAIRDFLVGRGMDAERLHITPLLVVHPLPFTLQYARYQVMLATSQQALAPLAKATSSLHTTTELLVLGEASLRVAEQLSFARARVARKTADELAMYVVSHYVPEDGPVLYARGRDVQFDLEGTLRDGGFTVDAPIVYDAQAVDVLPDALVAHLQVHVPGIILFFSARTALVFEALVRAEGLMEGCQMLTAVCWSDSIASQADSSMYSNVYSASETTMDALCDALLPVASTT